MGKQSAHEHYLDTSYEVWRSGRNPDRLDHDRVSDHYYNGHSPEHAASTEMRRWDAQRQRREQEENEMFAQEQEYYAQQDEQQWREFDYEYAMTQAFGPVVHPQTDDVPW